MKRSFVGNQKHTELISSVGLKDWCLFLLGEGEGGGVELSLYV